MTIHSAFVRRRSRSLPRWDRNTCRRTASGSESDFHRSSHARRIRQRGATVVVSGGMDETFPKKGMAGQAVLYLWDEPTPDLYPKILDRARVVLGADPEIRSLVTVPFTSKLEKTVQIWVSLVNCLEKRPDFDDFCRETPSLDAYAPELEKGKSLWFYQSCASHGCTGQGGQYFAGWPSYMIDASGMSNRVMQWIAWKYGISGELYYSMNEAWAHGGNPWTDLRLYGGNGDGTLFYPGRPVLIGGSTDIPIESIRLKLIREGMEDYEYLTLLANVCGKQSADDYVDRIIQKPWMWETRPEILPEIRLEMGKTLDLVTRMRTPGKSPARTTSCRTAV